MVIINKELCIGCARCVAQCPTKAIGLTAKKAIASEACVQCNICIRVCPENAISRSAQAEASLKCTHCPVQCEILPDRTGACLRYTHTNGQLMRNRPLETQISAAALQDLNSPKHDSNLRLPLTTAVGAGTNYPCCRPAPHIVSAVVDGMDVVTVVTEAPLSYSGLKVKIDTNFPIGNEGAKVMRSGQVVGMVGTEEYGSKMLSLGGANLLTGTEGFIVARTIVDLANGQEVSLKVEDGARLTLKVGQKPIIDGIKDDKMRVGCGSATVGLFASPMYQAFLAGELSEVIVLDHHVVGLFSEHLAGAEVGMSYSGVVPKARKSTRGRYFGEHGSGWGGTNINSAMEAIAEIDLKLCPPGSKILVTETTGRQAGLVQVQTDGTIKAIELTPAIKKLVKFIEDSCEEACVSILFTGGTGGSARGGVTSTPLALTKAVHEGKISMTIAGAPAFILPGGGINFMVDVQKTVPKAFTWVPTPATVAPVEYTMRLKDFKELGGHMQAVRPKSKN